MPVSLKHSDRIDPAELNGRRASTLEPTLRELAAQGCHDTIVLPFFLGPSRAITQFAPQKVHKVSAVYPNFRVGIAASLVDPSREADAGIAQILRDEVISTIQRHKLDRPPLIVVDHGSPEKRVIAVRDHVAMQLREMLGDQVGAFSAASMERRPGPAYAFNEPLLSSLLDAELFNQGAVIVCQLFLSEGRHAGPDGDIARICRSAGMAHAGLKTYSTRPIGFRPDLLGILHRRYRACLQSSIRIREG